MRWRRRRRRGACYSGGAVRGGAARADEDGGAVPAASCRLRVGAAPARRWHVALVVRHCAVGQTGGSRNGLRRRGSITARAHTIFHSDARIQVIRARVSRGERLHFTLRQTVLHSAALPLAVLMSEQSLHQTSPRTEPLLRTQRLGLSPRYAGRARRATPIP